MVADIEQKYVVAPPDLPHVSYILPPVVILVKAGIRRSADIPRSVSICILTGSWDQQSASAAGIAQQLTACERGVDLLMAGLHRRSDTILW
jgi:hypothetical protein